MPLFLIAASANAAAPRLPWNSSKQLAAGNAECILRRQGDEVRAWLAMLSGTKAERKAFSKIQHDFPNCFGAASEIGWTYSFESVPVREALIRYSLQTRLNEVPDVPPSKLQELNWYDAASLKDEGAAEAGFSHAVGKCLVATDWSASRALVGSLPGSKDEMSAVKRLLMALPGCVPPKIKVKMALQRLRAIVEEAVYHASLGASHA